MKMIDLSKSVHEICSEYPEVAEIMKEIGFKEIANPGMINTAGRFMTIPKGAAMRRINMDQIKETFAEKGFEISE
ncbi:MAG: DUF1858 domain-containing protein [Desulfitobacterium sp.]